MKSFIIFLIWISFWLILGWKLGYEYVMIQISDNMWTVVNTIMNKAGSGSAVILDQYKLQIQQEIEKQRTNLKDWLKQQITDYINKKIDEKF